jgi:hypothetical protein
VNHLVWCLTAAFLAVDLVLALSLLEWWLTREPEPVLTRANLDDLMTLCAGSALDEEEERDVAEFLSMMRRMDL